MRENKSVNEKPSEEPEDIEEQPEIVDDELLKNHKKDDEPEKGSESGQMKLF